jgi:hypothetical protein
MDPSRDGVAVPHRARSDGSRHVPRPNERFDFLNTSKAEIKRLRKALQEATDEARAEKARADAAERMVLEIAARLKTVNTQRVYALQDLATLRTELRQADLPFSH